MAKDKKANITLTGTYPDISYQFDGDNIDSETGDIGFGGVSGEIDIKFKIKSSGFEFYFAENGDAPISIDGTPANELTSTDQFNGYIKTDSKNIKIKDENSDGKQHTYDLQFTDGTNTWPLDPKIDNDSVDKLD